MSKKTNKKERIKPELLGGFRDYLPEVMISRQEIINNIKETFESFGFIPLDTPGLERSSVLGTNKDEFKMEVYRFKAGGKDVTLRFDLTVPLSRVIAAYPKLLKPFKRYQYGLVWRKEKSQAGRYREFAQFDADIVGSDSILADTEIINMMYKTMRNLDLDNFIIRFNNRKILNGLPNIAGFKEEKAPDVFRVLDKIEKIGLKEVIRELQRRPENECDKSALALSDASVARIKEFLNLSGDPQSLIKDLKLFFKGVEVAEEGIKECEEIIDNLIVLNIPEKNWKFDLSIARGLGYYTGPVFETILTDLPEIGSVFSGGRFDELVMRFIGEKIPAVGTSVGVDRLIAALEQLGKINNRKTTAKVLLTIINNDLTQKILQIAQRFRESGINTEIYIGKAKTLKDQIIYAVKREIPFVIIIGEEENRVGKLKFKDMNKREETLLTESEIIDKLKL
ncbi:MAG: histidine--tRNA ligase [Patescibacteria group bacterium]|nr:histidine--tRNA ligase [Patescibacteria group bacterium]